MITITKLTGEIFLTINYDKNIPIDYSRMRKLFDINIQLNSYYILVQNNEKIYTNLYDIYEIKFKRDIILNDLTIIFLPYDKKDVNHMKKAGGLILTVDFPNEDLRNDKLFILMAINYDDRYYQRINDELKYDKEIIYNTVMSNLWNDFSIFRHFYDSHENKYNEIIYDKEFMKSYICNPKSCNRFARQKLIQADELIDIVFNTTNYYKSFWLDDDTQYIQKLMKILHIDLFFPEEYRL